MQLNSTEEIIADLSLGKMVVIMDDEDRENEGDLMLLADKVSPEAINFMATHGRGLICLTITQKRSDQLKLWPQTGKNTGAFQTNFTVSIEAASGVTTGISAFDRAKTIQAAVKQDARPEDIVQPGHIFPIVAKEGGVLVRAGHTEAGCDFARLAGFEPASVIVEILKEDGTMARRPDLEIFAQKHQLKIGTIADLINYRLRKEKTINAVGSCQLPTKYGQFTLTAYKSIIDEKLHYAISKGVIDSNRPTFVRVQVQNPLSDLFQANLCERTHSLIDVLARLSKEDSGVVVVLDEGFDNQQIMQRINDFANQQSPQKTNQNLRTYGIGAQILLDQGVRKMRLLSNPYRFSSLSGYQLEVAEYLS